MPAHCWAMHAAMGWHGPCATALHAQPASFPPPRRSASTAAPLGWPLLWHLHVLACSVSATAPGTLQLAAQPPFHSIRRGAAPCPPAAIAAAGVVRRACLAAGAAAGTKGMMCPVRGLCNPGALSICAEQRTLAWQQPRDRQSQLGRMICQYLLNSIPAWVAPYTPRSGVGMCICCSTAAAVPAPQSHHCQART